MFFYLGKAPNKVKKTVSYLLGEWIYHLINIFQFFKFCEQSKKPGQEKQTA